MTDVAIIGAGVVGSAIARELSKFNCSIVVIEREKDVCEGTSKANSAIIHAGYDAIPGTLKARFNVEGNRMMDVLCDKLDIPFKRNGSLVLCFDKEKIGELEELKLRGEKNGVEGLEIISKEKALEIEPALSEDVAAALYAPTAGIVCPFIMTMAFAENACENGALFRLDECVRKIERIDGGYRIITDKGELEAANVVNAAGVYADSFNNMVSDKKLHITARRGEYCLMDKQAGALVAHTLFQLPGKYGKGILLTPTVHGNLMAGPTAENEDNKEGVYTTSAGLSKIIKEAGRSINNFPVRQIITSFAGLRAHEDKGDFVIGEARDAKGFFNAAGIESPGLTAAPAIGKYLAEMIAAQNNFSKKTDFTDTRIGIPCMNSASLEEQKTLIEKDPAFARVVCRCEMVTEGEIKAAIHRPLGATTFDGIKRRTRAGMGRCQSGFCSPKVMEILERELCRDMSEFTKNNKNSVFLTGYNKGGEKA